MAARKIPRRRMQRVLWDLAESGGTEFGSASAASGLALPWMRRCRPDGIGRLAQIWELCCRHRQAIALRGQLVFLLYCHQSSEFASFDALETDFSSKSPASACDAVRGLHATASVAAAASVSTKRQYHELDYRPRCSSPNTFGNYCIEVSV